MTTGSFVVHPNSGIATLDTEGVTEMLDIDEQLSAMVQGAIESGCLLSVQPRVISELLYQARAWKDEAEKQRAEVERLRVELERAQDAFRVIGYSPAYEQKQYVFDLGADEPSKGYSHWSWYPIAIARFMRDKIRKLE